MASRNSAVEGARFDSRRGMTPDPMPWLFLSTAILFEVAGITAMKLSRGFTEPVPSLAVLVFYVLSAAAVILALKRLDLSVTYAVWSGVGTALASSISASRSLR
jgi:small multidrug resistance pump